MSHHEIPHSNPKLPAPCIVDTGIIVNKEDMRRLLGDLGRVYYHHWLDSQLNSEGEGFVVEVFSDQHQSTLVANRALYINVQSFDYLQLSLSQNREAYFDLIQDNRQLRLIPQSDPIREQEATETLDVATIEAMVTRVLSAKCDVQLDDEDDDCLF